MKFVNIHMLWLTLVVVPLLVYFLWWAWKKKQWLIGQFVRSRLLAELTVGVSKTRQKGRIALLVGAVALIMLALARPQWGFSWEEARQRGIDIVIAIDTSRSLLAEDIQPNRFTRAKLAAWELVRLARTDRLGLVAFAGTAFLQLPLTLDEDAFRQSLDAIQIGIIPQGGSALAEAIETSLDAFPDEDNNHEVIVVLTDGEDHEGKAVEAAKKAAREGARVFTIGVGTTDGALLSIKNPDGSTEYLKDSNGAVVKSRLDEDLLRQIATAGNGFYLPLQGARTMETLYERGLEPLPKSEYSSKIIQRFHERFQWPLGIAIVLLIVESFIPDRKRPPMKKEVTKAEMSPVRKFTAAGLAILFLPTAALHASTGSAAKAYKKGDYEKAYGDYQRLLEEKPDDPKLHFNAGAAAYQQEKYTEAKQHFDNALRTDALDLQEKSYYSLGNTMYHIGAEASDPNQKMASWTDAVQRYESAVKLNPSDVNARYNLEVVKKKLEELKKQQQQQKEQNQQQQNQKDSEKQKQDQDKSDQEKKDQQQQDQQKQDQSQQQQKDQQQQQAPQPDQQEGKEQSKEQQQSQPQSQQGKEDSEKQNQQPVPMGKMTEEQARQLLEAMRSEEQSLLFTPTNQPSRSRRFFKDW